MNRSPVLVRLTLTCVLLALLPAGGCANLQKTDRLQESEAGPGRDLPARLMRMADDADGGGDPATAANLYGRVLALDPGRVDAARGLGDALLRIGRYQDAIDAFRRVLAKQPGDPEASRGMARALLALGRPDAALARLDEAAAAPDDWRLANLRGVALDQLGRHEEAQAVYRAALARVPENVALRTNLGLSLALADRFDEAIAELEPLTRGPQDSPRARHNLAAAYALKGEPSSAEALLKLDLPDKDVRSSLAYYAALRGLGANRSPKVARAMLRAPDRVAEAPPEAPAREPVPETWRRPVAAAPRARLTAPETEPALALASGGSPVAAPDPAVTVRPAEPPPAAKPADPAAVASAVASGPAGGRSRPDIGTSAPEPPSPLAAPPAAPVGLPRAAAPPASATPSVAPPLPVASPALAEPSEPAASPATAPLVPTGAPVPATAAAPDETPAAPLTDPPRPVAPAEAEAGAPGGTVPALTETGLRAEPSAVPEGAIFAVEPAAWPDTPTVPIEPAIGGDWVVELETVSDPAEGRARWRQLRDAHGEVLAGVARLGDPAAAGPLLAGPFADRAAAEAVCARLGAASPCTPHRL